MTLAVRVNHNTVYGAVARWLKGLVCERYSTVKIIVVKGAHKPPGQV